MNESVCIRCPGCGHEKIVDREWLQGAEPALASLGAEKFSQALHRIRNRFVCTECKRRDPELVPWFNSQTSEWGFNGRDRECKTRKHTKQRLRSSSVSVQIKTTSPQYRKRQNSLEALLRQAVWLYPEEISLLEDFEKQLNLGRSLSKRQLKTIGNIRRRIYNRQNPKAFPGGSPGLRGRKR